MKNFKGTPGPWEMKKIHGDLKVIVKGSYEKLAPGMVSYRRVTELENKHDASLIAAAPELLKELIKARKIIEESDEWWMDSPDRGGFDTESMDAAINKALGGE